MWLSKVIFVFRGDINNISLQLDLFTGHLLGFLATLVLRYIYHKYNYKQSALIRLGMVIVVTSAFLSFLWFWVHFFVEVLIYGSLGIYGNQLLQNMFFYVIYDIIILVAWSFIYFVIKMRNDLENEKMLMAEKIMTAQQAELQLLKYQLNPHFLFNSLNNLYGLALKNSPRTPEIILTLSALLNYMLYGCNSETTSLEKEIDMINDYIELEKLRYGQRLQTEFDITGRIEGINIAPALLLPFVENSFKHGASKEADNPWIKLCIKVNEKSFNFRVENNYKKNVSGIIEKNSGIGIRNVKRQLELLYPGKHNLEISSENENFTVSLTIWY